MSLCDEFRIEKGKEGSFLRQVFPGFYTLVERCSESTTILGWMSPSEEYHREEYSCAMFSRSTMEQTVHKTCAEELTRRSILQSYEQ